MKLIKLINQYIDYRRSLGEKYCSGEDYLNSFCRIVGKSSDLNKISIKKINEFLFGEKKLATPSWFYKYSTLKGFFRYSIGRGYISKSPLPTILPKRSLSFTPYIYSRDELRKLFKAALIYQKGKCFIEPYMIRVILILLYCTGLRISEALALTIADVDITQSLIIVRETKFYKTRLVPFGAQLSEIIKSYIAWREQHGFTKKSSSPFFINKKESSLNATDMGRMFKQIRKFAGIQRTDKSSYQPRLHDIRHSFAVHRLTSWYQEHADVQVLFPILSVYMGHARPSSTSIYLTMTNELLREAGTLFEKYAMGGVK
jgi:site-specific recombinase XerD